MNNIISGTVVIGVGLIGYAFSTWYNRRNIALEEKNAVIHTLKKQKAELEEHGDQLTQQLKRNEKEKKENKMNLQQVENTPGLLKEKEDLLKVTWKLDEQQREYEKLRNHADLLLLNIHTLLSIAAK